MNIEASTAVFRPSVGRVADVGECRGGYSGTLIGVMMLTVANHMLALLGMPESVRQTRGPSAALKTPFFEHDRI